MSGFFIRQGSTCWDLQLHPENAQTTRVDLTLAFGWVQFIAGKLTACHGLQKIPVQCNTVKKGWARGQQPTPRPLSSSMRKPTPAFDRKGHRQVLHGTNVTSQDEPICTIPGAPHEPAQTCGNKQFRQPACSRSDPSTESHQLLKLSVTAPGTPWHEAGTPCTITEGSELQSAEMRGPRRRASQKLTAASRPN